MNIADAMSGHAQPRERPGRPMPMAEHGAHESGSGGVHEHLSALHAEMGGKHMHIHHDGMGGITSHQVHEDGHHEGPHNHENMEALKSHMDKFLGEEEQEGAGNYGGEEKPSGGHGSLFG